MYEANEKLIVLEDISYGKTKISEGSEVTFVKTVDNQNDLSKSIVLIQYDDKIIPVLELKVKPLNEKKVTTTFKEFNKLMYASNPRLRMYHPNPLVRFCFRIYYYFKDKHKEYKEKHGEEV